MAVAHRVSLHPGHGGVDGADAPFEQHPVGGAGAFPAIAPSRWSATRRTNPWPLVDQIDDRKANRDVLGRARFFAPLVDVPADRLLAGGVARSVESALWDVEEGRPANGEAAMRSARVLARLL